MDEKFKNELGELQKLQEAGTLIDENQKKQFELLNQIVAVEKTADEKSKLAETTLAQKEHFRTKTEALEKELETLKKEPPKPTENKGMDAEEVANLSVAFNGLDEVQRIRLIREVKASGQEVNSKTLGEVRKSEDYLFWDKSYTAKVATEKKIPIPGGANGASTEKTPAEIAKMTREEHIAYEKEISANQKGEGV